MENNKENITENTNTETIFNDDEFSLEGYNKNIRQARNTLLFLAGLQLLLGLFTIFTSHGNAAWITTAMTTLVAIIFFVLGLWTKQKPYTAIMYALIIYILLWVGDSIFDPTYIYKGILVKIIVVVYLAKGLKDAREAQSMKKIIGG